MYKFKVYIFKLNKHDIKANLDFVELSIFQLRLLYITGNFESLILISRDNVFAVRVILFLSPQITAVLIFISLIHIIYINIQPNESYIHTYICTYFQRMQIFRKLEQRCNEFSTPA